MDIREALLAEHSKRQTMKVVRYVGDDPKRFSELMALFIAGPYRVTQRAAWPISYCIEQHNDLVKPYLGRLVSILEASEVDDSIRRNVARLLQFVDIPPRFRGRVFDACCNLVDDPSRPVAVRVFSMTVAAKAAIGHLDLERELALVINKYVKTGSAGFRARARKVLR
jgi:hypothetical protein